jgi:competence protein ComEC
MSDVHETRFSSHPLFVLAAVISLGILAGHFCPLQPKAILVAVSIVNIVFVTLSVVFLLKKKLTRASILLMFSFLLTGALLSQIGRGLSEPDRIARMYETGEVEHGEPVEITGAIVGEPEPAPGSFYLTLQPETIRVKERERTAAGTLLLMARTHDSQVSSQYDALQMHHGARIRLLVTLDREEDFRNPGVFPFTEYLERKGYDATGVIKSPLLIERLPDRAVFLPLAWVYQWRARLQNEFKRNFSAETAGVLNAALLGNAHNISKGTAERFRAGGTFHILVISGMQIAFIAGLAFLFVRRLTRNKALQFVLASGFLWAYTIAVGAEASVTRAALMFTIAAFAPVLARKPVSLNTIGAAALALLILRPDDLFDPSFQLTFLSVIAIVCLAVPLLRNMQRTGSWRPTMATPYPPQCSRWFRVLSESLFWKEREWNADVAASNIRYRLFKSSFAIAAEKWHVQGLLRFAFAALIISASVQVVLLPAMIIYFHRISIASLLLNIFVGALMVVLVFAAMAAVLVSLISASLAAPLIVLAEKSNWLIVHLVDPFSGLGIDSIRLPYYSGWWAIVYALYFLPLVFLTTRLGKWEPLRPPSGANTPSRKFQMAMIMLVLLLGVIVFHPFSAAKPDGHLHVDFLDVGQGDAALLTLPDGTTLLIDGGGKPNFARGSREVDDEEPFERDSRSIGERVVSEYLWSRGLDRVDYLIATHADADHIEGLKDVARNFKVRGAIVARAPARDPEFTRFAEALSVAAVPISIVNAGDLVRVGNVSIEILWPPSVSNPSASSHNDDSLVLRVIMGEKIFLFTGDIEKKGEALLLAKGIHLRSDVVKVAHHGSRTSSIAAFVSATRPSLAVIPVGRTSLFGHPHKEVVERWRASGAEVITTGEKGTISVSTDGRSLKVNTFLRD